jgi:hypothetical protein
VCQGRARFDGFSNAMKISREEILGPVLSEEHPSER